MADTPVVVEYSMTEVATHTTKESTWLVIKDMNDGDTPKVYDVSSYLNDHPGGAEVMMEVAGQDATNMFEDIGHSSDARTEMKKFQIGLLKLTDEERAKIAQEAAKKAERASRQGGGLNPLAVLVLLLAISIGYYYSNQKA
ncbi:unnamed protein product [Ectocarpus sp. CCAP 1310/34]|nr:unnamed protein product [Ectocarpus sp. CCAP 1310/34]